MAEFDKFLLGEAVVIQISFTDPFLKNLVDADTVTITIKDPDNTVVATEDPMDRMSLGTYRYYFETESTDKKGKYVAYMTGVFSGKTTKAKKYFKLID